MPIALKPVKSSFISAIGYDLASRTLAVRFAVGNVEHYPDVPPEVAEAFGKAESPGRFFGSQIRGQYQHVEQAAVAESTEGGTPD